MAVKEALIQVGVKDKFLDAVEVEQSDGTPALREAVVQTDAEDFDARVNVRKIDQISDYAGIVKDHQLAQIADTMRELLVVQKGMLKLLEAAFEDSLSGRDELELHDGLH